MRITSGYRHPSHPIEAKKGTPGEHTHRPLCVDVGVEGKDAFRLIQVATEARHRPYRRPAERRRPVHPPGPGRPRASRIACRVELLMDHAQTPDRYHRRSP
jgi:hypothetical protein